MRALMLFTHGQSEENVTKEIDNSQSGQKKGLVNAGNGDLSPRNPPTFTVLASLLKYQADRNFRVSDQEWFGINDLPRRTHQNVIVGDRKK